MIHLNVKPIGKFMSMVMIACPKSKEKYLTFSKRHHTNEDMKYLYFDKLHICIEY